MEKIYVIGHKNPDVDSVISGILMQKLLEKIKLRRMSGILPQDLDSKARYRANIKYRD